MNTLCRRPLPDIYILACSRYLPTIETTRILSVYPATDGRRQHIPRTMSSILTPRRDDVAVGEPVELRAEVGGGAAVGGGDLLVDEGKHPLL